MRNGALAYAEPQLLENTTQLPDRQRGKFGDGAIAKAQLQRHWIEPRSVTGFARLRRVGVGDARRPLRFLAGLIGFEASHLDAGAEAARAPALAGIE